MRYSKNLTFVCVSSAVLLIAACTASTSSQSGAMTITKQDLQQNIELSIGYLQRMINSNKGGVHKYYYAEKDEFEPRIHTIYTASTVFTLLNVVDSYKYNRAT